ncbi:MAG: hypothetical protein HY583_00625 [Candidatus Omnitrophica bacterium]|nr:hypothetical protein [Candidatus Omnitrophota bacterium]
MILPSSAQSLFAQSTESEDDFWEGQHPFPWNPFDPEFRKKLRRWVDDQEGREQQKDFLEGMKEQNRRRRAQGSGLIDSGDPVEDYEKGLKPSAPSPAGRPEINWDEVDNPAPSEPEQHYDPQGDFPEPEDPGQLAISNSAEAGKIFQHDDGTGWEYGRDAEGRPTTTIHHPEKPYDNTIINGGKSVRTFDPKTGAPIHNQVYGKNGTLLWEEVINPETGETVKTDYVDLDGKPILKTSTYNNYWVKKAAIDRREGVKEEESSLFDGMDEWTDNIEKGLQDLANQWKDFISGGSLGITNKTKDVPAKPETPEPKRPETGNWNFLKEYDPRDFIPKPPSSEEANPPSGEEAKKKSGGLLAPSKSSDTAKINVPSSPDLPVILQSPELIDSKSGSDVSPKPFFTDRLGSFNEPTPKEIDYNKYGDATGLDPHRGVTFVTNSKTGEITYFYPRYDDKFKDPQGGTQAVTMRNGKVVGEDNYDHLGELIPSDSRPLITQIAEGYLSKFGEGRGGGTNSSLGTTFGVSITSYHINNSMSVGMDVEYMLGDDEGSEATQTPVTPEFVDQILKGTVTPSQIRQTQGVINFYQEAIPNLETRLKKREAEAERFNELWEEARRKGDEAKMDEYGRKAAEAEVEAGNLKKELERYHEDLTQQREKLKTLQEQQKTSKSSKKKDADLGSSFNAFDAFQQGGLGTLGTTPTGTFDSGPQSRDMGTGTSGGGSTPDTTGPKADCDH